MPTGYKNPPRRRTPEFHLTKCKAIYKRFVDRYRAGESWAAIGAEIGISGTTVYRAVVEGYEPRDNDKRRALGLPATVAVAVCPDCGRPPLSQRHKCGDRFARNAAEYDRWRAAQMPNILDILNWAETR